MTSTRGNPRLAQSGTALTSLGAVGGARGTAAGALRVFVEFLTTYDKGNIDALKSDLASVNQASQTSAAAEKKRLTEIASLKSKLDEADRISKGKLNTQLRSDLRKIESLEQSRSKTNRELGAAQRIVFNETAKSLNLSKEELGILAQKENSRKRLAILDQRQAQAEQGQHQRTQQQLQLQLQQDKLEQGRESLGSRLGGLAIGALGGIVGGAVLGLGFTAAQDALAKLGDKLQDLFDPARHARDAIKELGDEVAKLASTGHLSFLDAAKEKLKELGLQTDESTASLLAQFAAQQAANNSVADWIKILEARKHPEAAQKEAVDNLTDALIAQAEAEGNIRTIKTYAPVSVTSPVSVLVDATDRQYYYNQALQQYNNYAGIAAGNAEALARAQTDQANAAALATAKQDALTSALQAAAAHQIAAVQSQEDALGTGESSRTKRIQSAIDALSSAGGGNGAQLRSLAEDRQLIILRQRLRLLGQNIDLERYSGKFLLEAINAKIAAIQKEGAEQNRLNAALDLQFKMSQQIKRQSGESIQDFVERRAQEQRGLLAQQDQQRRDAQISSLQDLQQKVQDEVDLASNAEQRKTALAAGGIASRQKLLQKELDASRKADAKELARKKKLLEDEKAAIQKKTDEAIALASDQATGEALAAIAGAKSVEDIAFLSGKISGLRRAKGTIESLVAGFLIPAFIAKPFLDNINKQLNAFGSAQKKIDPDIIFGGGRQKFAGGGIFELKNSRSPFGSNIQAGEEGTELGFILSHKMSEAFKKNSVGADQVGPFNVYGDGPMDKRLQYQLKKIVTEAVAQAVNR